MKVLIGNINIDNYHMLSALAGIAGFDRSIEFTCEISASIEIMEDDFVNKAGILKMLDEFIAEFTLKCIFSMGLRNDCLIKFLKYFCIA